MRKEDKGGLPIPAVREGAPAPSNAHAEPSAALSARDLKTLRALEALHNRHPSNPYGFLPGSFGGVFASAAARRMEPRGLVRVSRIADNCFRYALTTAGYDALPTGEPS